MKKVLSITGLVVLGALFFFGGTVLAQSDTPTTPPVHPDHEDMMGDSYGHMENGFYMMDSDWMGSFDDMMNDGSHMWENGSDWMDNGYGMMGGYGSGMWGNSSDWMGSFDDMMNDGSHMWENGSDWMNSYGSNMMGDYGSGMWGNGSDWMGSGSDMGSGYNDNGMGSYGR